MYKEMSYEDAWENIEFRKILNAATKRYASMLDADDVMSLQMATLWKCLQKYREDSPMSFTTYLYTQALYTTLNLLKKQGRRLKFRQVGDLNLDIITKPIDNSLRDDMNKVLSDLKPDERQLLEDRFFAGMTFEEIAESNGFSKEKARRKLKYVLQKTKKLV